jgi:hypothetical protein
VTLPSNINPAYEALDLAHPEEGFERALAQLREWGLQVGPVPEVTAAAAQLSSPVSEERPPSRSNL